MRTSTGLWGLLGLGLLAGIVVGTRALSPQPSVSEIVDAGALGKDAAEAAKLEGTGTPVEPTYAGVSDLRTLLQATWADNDAEARLVELAADDPAVAGAVAAWLDPAYDLVRRPHLPSASIYGRPPGPDLESVCHALGRLGPAGVEALAAGLTHDEPQYRARMAECLGRLGASAAPAVPALLARLDGDREDGHGQAAMLRALGQIGRVAASEALPVFEAYLRDEHRPDEARAAAAESYLDLGGATDETLAICAGALQDQSFEVCITLIPELGRLGEQAKPVVPALVALVADPDAHDLAVMAAVWAIGEIGVVDKTIATLLLDIAFGERRARGYRSTAVHALVELGGDSTSMLLERASAEDDETRLRIARILPPHVSEGRVPVGAVLELLDPIRGSEWEDDRCLAVGAAFGLEPPAPVLVPWLEPWLADRHPDVREGVVSGLGEIWDPDGIIAPALVRATTDPDAGVRLAAVRAILARAEGELGDRDHLCQPAVVDAVVARLDDAEERWDGRIDVAAAHALNALAPERNAAAIAQWIRILEDYDWTEDQEAAQILGTLGPRAAAAIPALEAAIECRARWPESQKVFQAALEQIRGR